MQHKAHPKLQKLLESNAASRAFPTMPKWATKTSEKQERVKVLTDTGFICSAVDKPAANHMEQRGEQQNKSAWICMNCTIQNLLPSVSNSHIAYTSPEIAPNFSTPLWHLLFSSLVSNHHKKTLGQPARQPTEKQVLKDTHANIQAPLLLINLQTVRVRPYSVSSDPSVPNPTIDHTYTKHAGCTWEKLWQLHWLPEGPAFLNPFSSCQWSEYPWTWQCEKYSSTHGNLDSALMKFC